MSSLYGAFAVCQSPAAQPQPPKRCSSKNNSLPFQNRAAGAIAAPLAALGLSPSARSPPNPCFCTESYAGAICGNRDLPPAAASTAELKQKTGHAKPSSFSGPTQKNTQHPPPHCHGPAQQRCEVGRQQRGQRRGGQGARGRPSNPAAAAAGRQRGMPRHGCMTPWRARCRAAAAGPGAAGWSPGGGRRARGAGPGATQSSRQPPRRPAGLVRRPGFVLQRAVQFSAASRGSSTAAVALTAFADHVCVLQDLKHIKTTWLPPLSPPP